MGSSSRLIQLISTYLVVGLAACTSTTQQPQVPEKQDSFMAAQAEQNPDNSKLRILVGSGFWGTETGMVSVFTFDPQTGLLEKQSSIAAGGLLSFLTVDSTRSYLYAADEGHGLLRSFKIDPTSGDLSPISKTKTDSGPVYLAIDKDNSSLLAAQFNSGKTQRFPLHADGTFGNVSSTLETGGESHASYVTPDGKYLLVPSRATDKVSVFQLTPGAVTHSGEVQLPRGSGCRHVDFHPNGETMYLVNEFANSLVTYRYNAENGTFAAQETVTTLPQGFSGESSAADVHVHPSGRFVYVSNRPANEDGTVAAYSISKDGTLELLEHESTQGRTPRSFGILPGGTHLIVGNQDSNSISSYKIDKNTGELTLLRTNEVNVRPFFVGALQLAH